MHSRWKNQAQSLLKNSHFSSFPSLICFFGFLPSAQNSLDPYCEPSKILAPLFMFVSLALQEKLNVLKKDPTPTPQNPLLFSFALNPSFPFVIQLILNFKYFSLFFFQSTTSLFLPQSKFLFRQFLLLSSLEIPHKLFVLKLNMHITYLSNNESI